MQPGNNLYALKQGINAAKAGDRTTARDLLQRATEIQPNNEQAWFWLACVTDNQKYRLSYLRRTLHINPQHEPARSVLRKALLQAGKAAADTGEKGQARLHFLEIIEVDARDEEAWLWLASVSETYRDVKHCLHRVLEINPNNERAISWLSADLEQPPSATQAWTCPLCGFASTVKADRCDKCKAVLTLGELDALIDNDDADLPLIHSAIDRYNKIAEANSSFGLHFTLGLAYLNLKQTEEGISHLQNASRLQPENHKLRSQVETLIQKLNGLRVAKPEIQRPIANRIPSRSI